jgi:hypothetical protein
VRYRKRHRTQYADLVRALHERSRQGDRSRGALEAEDLDPFGILSRHDHKRHAGAPRPLLADRRPRLTGVEVQHVTRERVVDGRAVEHREHDAEQRDTLLRVEAAVDGIDQDQRVRSAEAAQPGLLGEDREPFAALGQGLELGKDDGLRRPVELQRRVATGADLEPHAPGLGACNRKHGVAHTAADALKKVEPVAGVQNCSYPASGKAGVNRHFAAAAAAALDDDRDEVGLLHRPHALDELRDGNAMGSVDTQQDEGLRNVVGQLCLVVEVELLQRFEDVIQPAQTLPPILIGPVEHL